MRRRVAGAWARRAWTIRTIEIGLLERGVCIRTDPAQGLVSSRHLVENAAASGVVRAALGLASAHDALAGERPVRLGDDGVLALGILRVVMEDPNPVPGALQLVRL